MDERLKPKIGVVGSINMDVVVEASRYPEQGETILGEKVHFIPGGKGANQAVAAARLGAQTVMIGSVGQDEFGNTLLASLKKEQIEVSGVKQIPDIHSGIASILLSEKDNRIIMVPGANYELVPQDLDQGQDLIKQVDILLLQLEIPINTVEYAVQLAKKHQKPVVLNPAPAAELSNEVLGLIDYITPNRSELTYLTGMEINDDHELETAMSALIDKGPKHVVTTLGDQGAVYMGPDRRLNQVPSYQVKVVDTTGAGDAFNAAFAYSIALGKGMEAAVAFAVKVSALKVTKLGAQTGMPYLREVLDFDK